MSEYYVGGKYAKTAEGDEFYIKTGDSKKIYLRDEYNAEVYAKYNAEVYAKYKHRYEFYATIDGKPIFARDSNRLMKYARTGLSEFYYIDDEFVYVIEIDNVKKYIKQEDFFDFFEYTTNFNLPEFYQYTEVYPKIKNKEIILDTYAKNKYNFPFYPKDFKSDEYKDENYIIIGKVVIYPINANKAPQYPKDDKGNEYYEIYDDTMQIFYTCDNEKIYAKLVNNRYKQLNELTPKYALNYSKTEVVFPKTNDGDEYYIEWPEGTDYVENVTKYAKDKDGNEIYPKSCIKGEYYRENVLNGKYANRANKEPYYPIDEYGNEYVINNQSYLINKPITHDGYEIITQYKKENEIKGLLRENEYVSNTKSSVKPRQPFKTTLPYKLIQVIKYENNTRSFWTILSMIFTVLAFILKWLMIKYSNIQK